MSSELLTARPDCSPAVAGRPHVLTPSPSCSQQADPRLLQGGGDCDKGTVDSVPANALAATGVPSHLVWCRHGPPWRATSASQDAQGTQVGLQAATWCSARLSSGLGSRAWLRLRAGNRLRGLGTAGQGERAEFRMGTGSARS